jgi:hypothetical protein
MRFQFPAARKTDLWQLPKSSSVLRKAHPVIPAKAGIHPEILGSRFRWNDEGAV